MGSPLRGEGVVFHVKHDPLSLSGGRTGMALSSA
jgi:hypothetical protein